jgi:hypothetical protein
MINVLLAFFNLHSHPAAGWIKTFVGFLSLFGRNKNAVGAVWVYIFIPCYLSFIGTD